MVASRWPWLPFLRWLLFSSLLCIANRKHSLLAYGIDLEIGDPFSLSTLEVLRKKEDQQLAREEARRFAEWAAGDGDEEMGNDIREQSIREQLAQQGITGEASSRRDHAGVGLQNVYIGKNASIVHGYFTMNGLTEYVGMYTSNISDVLVSNFPKSGYGQMRDDTYV